MGTWIQDIRYGLRLLLRKPLLTAAAVLSLAIGIGSNVTVFNWVKAFLLQPYPGVSNPSELVLVGERSQSGTHNSLSYPNYVDLRDRATSLAGIVVFRDAPIALGESGGTARPELLFGSIVSGNFFDVLGVRAAVGRTFLPEEDRTPGTHPVVVLSHALWSRRFAGNPAIMGTTIPLNGQAFTVIGVAPERFYGSFMGVATDLWVPMMMEQQVQPGESRLSGRGNHWLQSIARLKPGEPISQGQAEIDTIMAQLATQYPDTNEGRRAVLYEIWDAPFGASNILKPVLLLLWIVVGLVLLIACANVANVLLVRAVGRRREIAMRLSLGASRGRLIRQMFTESLTLAVIAGVVGLAVTPWTTGLLVSIIPPTGLPTYIEGGLDRLTLQFGSMVILFTALAFGIVPALHATRGNLFGAIKDEATAAVGGSRTRLRGALVMVQVSLSVFLLIGAGLFLRSLQASQTFDVGITHRNVLLAGFDLFPLGYTPQTGREFQLQLVDRVRELPGVESVALARRVPLGFRGTSSTSFTVEGYQPAEGEELNVLLNWVSPDYFETIGLPVLRGREFRREDQVTAPRVVMVNETMAQRYWPGREAVGGRMRIRSEWLEVVGVVRDAKYVSIGEKATPYFYLPMTQEYVSSAVLHVRTNGRPEARVEEIRNVFRQLNPNLPVFDVKTMDEHLQIAMAPQRIAATLLSTFGSMALFLAALGLYSVLAYVVSQRTREVGIRMALGAGRARILSMVVRQGMWLSVVGTGIGVLLAFAVTRFLSSQLHGVSPTDPFVFAFVPLTLLVVAGLAIVEPTRRALRVDPMRALRHD